MNECDREATGGKRVVAMRRGWPSAMAALLEVAMLIGCASLARGDRALMSDGTLARAGHTSDSCTKRLHDGVARWSLSGGAITFWVQSRPAEVRDGWHMPLEFEREVLTAASGWNGIVPGLRLTPTVDSAGADVHVIWRPVLRGRTAHNERSARALGDSGVAARQLAGLTTLVFSPDGRAVSAVVELGARTSAGRPYSPKDVRVVAQHEVGHVLGLPHHTDNASIMAARPTARWVSRADRVALRRLYLGSIERRVSRVVN